MSMMPDLPHEREMRVRVCQFSVQIDFFSARESGRHYTARIPHAQLATLLAMAQESDRRSVSLEVLEALQRLAVRFSRFCIVR